MLLSFILYHLLASDYVPYVLIGAGTASFAAAKSIKKKDPKAKILIIGRYIAYKKSKSQ